MKPRLFILSIAIGCLSIHTCIGQKVILKITDNYFRYNPFEREFSNFMNHLLKDTLLEEKQIIRRTDSTLFFFKGIYKKYNSFGLNLSRAEVRLAESEIELEGPTLIKDTILLYQVLIYTNTAAKNSNDVQKEFERFNRKYKSGFAGEETKDLKVDNKVSGQIRDYFVGLSSIAPVSVAYINGSNEESLFAVTIRLIVKENIALLPQAGSSDVYLSPYNDQ